MWAVSTTRETLLVIGSGTMGAGIAQAAAMAGYRTLVYDSAQGQVERGLARIHADLDKGVQLGKVPAAVRDAALSCLEPAADLGAAAAQAGFAIEAVIEDMSIKQEVFKGLAARASKERPQTRCR